MNQKNFIVDPYKYGVAAATCIVSLALGITLLTIHRMGSSFVFLAIAAVFAYIAFLNGSTVRLTKEGVSLHFWKISRKFVPWPEIREVGVAGTKYIRQKNKDDVGSVFIYFSKKEMSDEERNQMLFAWPPKDMIYMRFIDERLFQAQLFYPGKIIFYHSGKIHL